MSTKNKKLRVWWIPQIPMEAFYVEVNTLEQADLLLTTLADYDIFQFENKIKPDYANVGGLQVFEDHEEINDWMDWYDEENDMDFDEYRKEVLNKEPG